LVSVGIGGSLTSRQVDIAIMDDLYKDAASAWSATIRETVQYWYETVLRTRLHNDSQQLLVFTRWHEEDLAGYLLKTEPEKWEVVLFEAIKTDIFREYDKRETGQVLWESKHSLEEMLSIRDKNPVIFDSLYQQNPTPKEGLVIAISDLDLFDYDLLMEGLKLDENKQQTNPPDGIISMCDIADEGDDSLCNIVGYLYGTDVYIVDVIFSKAPIEVTKPRCAEALLRHGVHYGNFESNNGGKGYAQDVKRMIKEAGGRTIVKWKPTTQNKHTKVVMASGNIKATFKFRKDYRKHKEYNEYMYELTHYPLNGKVKNDDAIDCTSMLSDMTTAKVGIDFLR